MLLLKQLLIGAGIAMFVIAAGILAYDFYLLIVDRRARLQPLAEGATPLPPPPIARWRSPPESSNG